MDAVQFVPMAKVQAEGKAQDGCNGRHGLLTRGRRVADFRSPKHVVCNDAT